MNWEVNLSLSEMTYHRHRSNQKTTLRPSITRGWDDKEELLKVTKSRQRVGEEPRVRGVLEVEKKNEEKTVSNAVNKPSNLRTESWPINLLILRLFVTLAKRSFCYSNPHSSLA